MMDLCVIWNMIYVKVWSKHSIFSNKNIVLRLLVRCLDLWVLGERDDPNSIGILESYRWRVLGVRVEGGSYDCVWSLKEFIIADHMNLPVLYEDEFPEGEIMLWWEHGNMICACLWVLISIHRSFGSRVKCLIIVVSGFLAWVMWNLR